MANFIRLSACLFLSLLSALLAVLGLVSLGLAAWQWGEIVSDDVTLSEFAAIHGRYTRTLVQLYLILGGIMLLLGITGVMTGILLVAGKLRITTGVFTRVFLIISFTMVTKYIVMTSLFWEDWLSSEQKVLGELTTRVQGSAYLQNSFQFRTYWDTWQTEHRCCGVNNLSDFSNSAAAVNTSNPITWLPNSCCNISHPLATCNHFHTSLHPDSCQVSVSAALAMAYWSQIGVVVAIWVTFLCLIPVVMTIFATCGSPRDEEY